MQAVILAAGLGTRMGSLTKDRPKPLLTIAHKSLLHHGLDALPDEVEEVILVVGYLAHQIKSAIGDSYNGKKITYIEQKELKGTGHALSICKDLLKDKFLVIMGDDLYSKEDLTELASHPMSILIREITEDSKNDFFAEVVVDNTGKLVDIVERQPVRSGSFANCGAYVMDKRFFDLPLALAGNKTAELGLPQTMLGLVKKGERIDIVKATKWHKVTSPEDLQEVDSNQ